MSAALDLLAQGAGVPLWVVLGLSAVSFLGSLMAAALGIGGGVLVLAVLALVFPPAVLIPLHGVVQAGSNLGRAVLMAREVMGRVFAVFVVGAALGVALAANVVVALPGDLLQGIVAGFILYAAWAPRFRARAPSRSGFFALGLAAAFATMFVGATGPLVAPFVAAASPDRRRVVATHAALMAVQHLFKIAAFGALGFAFAPYLPLLAGMLGFGFLGTVAGRRILIRLPERVFRLGFRLVLTGLALRLLYGAAQAVLA